MTPAITFASSLLFFLGWRLWRTWTFRTTASLRTERAYRALRIRALQEIPAELARPAIEEAAQLLGRLGFRPIGVMEERIGRKHFNREFYSGKHAVYASLFAFKGRPVITYLSGLSDGSLLYTGSSSRDTEVLGKLTWRGNDLSPQDRLEDHVREVERRARETGAQVVAAGTIEERMDLCREFYRNYCGVGRSA